MNENPAQIKRQLDNHIADFKDFSTKMDDRMTKQDILLKEISGKMAEVIFSSSENGKKLQEVIKVYDSLSGTTKVLLKVLGFMAVLASGIAGLRYILSVLKLF